MLVMHQARHRMPVVTGDGTRWLDRPIEAEWRFYLPTVNE